MISPPIVGLTLNYRDAQRTVRCVHSMLYERCAYVLICDNSADGGASVSNLRRLLSDEPQVSMMVNPENLGFAAGVNRGLAWIRARFPKAWVLLLNNDAVLLSGAINGLRAALLANPQAVIAYPIINHGGQLIGTAFYHRLLGLITTKPWQGSMPYASGCCQLLAPERLTGNWFDEDFFMYGEDVELGWRLGSERMVHVPQVLVKHEGSASSGMATDFYETKLVESHLRLVKKLAKNPIDCALMLFGRCVTLPLRALVRAVRYRSTVPFTALVKGWRLAYSGTGKHLS